LFPRTHLGIYNQLEFPIAVACGNTLAAVAREGVRQAWVPAPHFPEGSGGNARASRFRKRALERERLPGIFPPAVSFPRKLRASSQELEAASHRQIRTRDYRSADFHYRPV
jgi:hypothetical protein